MKNVLKTTTSLIFIIMIFTISSSGSDSLNMTVIGERIEKNILKHEYQVKFTKLEIKDVVLTPEIEERVKSILKSEGIEEDNPKYKEMYKSQLNLFMRQMSSVYRLLEITESKDYSIYAYKQLKDNLNDKLLSDMEDYWIFIIVDKKKNCSYEIFSLEKNVVEHRNTTLDYEEFMNSQLYPERFLESDYFRDKELFSDLYVKIDKKNFPFLTGEYNYFEHKDNGKIKEIFGFSKSDCRLMEIISHLNGTIKSTMKWSNYSTGKKFDYPVDSEFIEYDKNNKIVLGRNYHIIDLKIDDVFPRYASIQEIIIKNSKPEYKYVVEESGRQEKKGTVGEYLKQ